MNRILLLLLLLLFATLTPCFGAVLKKESLIDSTVFYQEGIYEYDLNLSQHAVFEFGTVHPNSDLSRVILVLHNDSKDTLFIRKMKQVGLDFWWRHYRVEKIAPYDTLELRIDFEKDSFTTFDNQFEFTYSVGRTKSFFSLKTNGSLSKGNAVITFMIPPKIQQSCLEKDSLSPIRYNGEKVNETNQQGFKEGKWVFFYGDGTVKKIATYFNGYEVGESFAYYPAGNLNTHKNYDNHVDLYYAEEGPLFLRALPDSLIFYYPSGKVEQLNINDRVYFYEETGSPIYSPHNRHTQALHDYEMLLEATYYENGNIKKRRYSNGRTFQYSENERNCIAQISEEPFRRPKRELYFNQCELAYMDVYTSISDAYQPKMECIRNERGEFRVDTLFNGQLTFLNVNGDTLFARKIVDGQQTSDLFLQQQHYNFTDSLGRRQGIWIYNSMHSQTWSDYGFPLIRQKFEYKNDTLQYPFYHYHDNGKKKSVYYGEVDPPKASRLDYSLSGNLVGELIGEIYYGYSDAPERIQTAYNDGSKLTYVFSNGRLVKRSTPSQEDYLSMEMPCWRSIPYSVSEGTFRNYHIYNGTIKYYDEKGILKGSFKVMNGAVEGDQIVILKDAFLEQELLFQTSIDLDHNGYITRSEASMIKHIAINGMRIREVSDFWNFTNLQALKINHCQIDPSTFKSSTRLLAAIKKAQAKPYVPPQPDDWRDIDIEPVVCFFPEDTADGIYDFPEHEAQFPGGQDSLMAYIAKNLKYPSNAKEMSIQGVVYLRFIINTDGTISEIEVLKGVESEMDAEAVRVVREMPKWIPAKNRGKAVRTRYTLPVRFMLG